ncbi:hypothetical protein O6H91_03G058700 [Diphasiastrum complanatum]|nr:hypothetical protein O6H91_03G058700 [Diphasiastrum complanatum]
MFYFHGQANKDFCLVSDKNLHINAHFIGKRPEGRTRDYTWVKALGIMFDSHKFTVAVKKVSTWNDQFDQLLFSHDGVPITVEAKQLASWTSDNGEVRIERVAATNNVEIVIDRVMAVSLSVKPITEKESKIHKYQITADDCFAHLDIQFKFFNLSSSVDGVLGQTYRPNFSNPVKAGVPMPIMGGEDKYLSSTLLSSDCKSSQFTPSQSDSSNVDYIQISTAECSTRNGLSGIFCRR